MLVYPKEGVRCRILLIAVCMLRLHLDVSRAGGERFIPKCWKILSDGDVACGTACLTDIVCLKFQNEDTARKHVLDLQDPYLLKPI